MQNTTLKIYPVFATARALTAAFLLCCGVLYSAAAGANAPATPTGEGEGEAAPALADKTPPAADDDKKTVGRVALRWTPPENDGGASITAYIVSYGNSVVFGALTVTVTGATVEGLALGGRYLFSVQAQNMHGIGPAATLATLASLAPPVDVASAAGTTTVTAGAGNDLADASSPTLDGGKKPASIDDDDVAQAPPPPAATVPAALAFVRATRINGNGVSLSWGAPVADGGASVVRYVVEFARGNGGFAAAPPAALHTAIVVGGINPLADYAFRARAENTVGGGAWTYVALVGAGHAAHRAVLPGALAAMSQELGQQMERRFAAAAAMQGGARFGVLGANFNGEEGGLAKGIAEILRRHGGKIENGGIDKADALNGARFALGGGGGLGVWGEVKYGGENGDTQSKRAYYAGADAPAGKNWTAGVLLSRNESVSNFSADGLAGTYQLRASGAHPYALWQAEGRSRLWFGFGQSAGEATAKDTAGNESVSQMRVRHGIVSMLRALNAGNGARYNLRADAAVARAELRGDNNAEFYNGNYRALLEARGNGEFAGGHVSPFAQAGFRRVDNADASASGWEAKAGAQYAAGAWRADINAAAIRLNGKAPYRAFRLAAALQKSAAANGAGLSFAVRPQWAPANGISLSDDFWKGMPESSAAAPEYQTRVEAQAAYGIVRRGLWTPYLGVVAGDKTELKAGAKWRHNPAAQVGIAAALEVSRVNAQSADAATGARFNLSLRY